MKTLKFMSLALVFGASVSHAELKNMCIYYTDDYGSEQDNRAKSLKYEIQEKEQQVKFYKGLEASQGFKKNKDLSKTRYLAEQTLFQKKIEHQTLSNKFYKDRRSPKSGFFSIQK
jgi:hypothetical protein